MLTTKGLFLFLNYNMLFSVHRGDIADIKLGTWPTLKAQLTTFIK